jgi:hypothetical protein
LCRDAVTLFAISSASSRNFAACAVIEPLKAQRAGMWAAVGGIAGYYGFKEQQALRAALLQRQQELEQSECCCVCADAMMC